MLAKLTYPNVEAALNKLKGQTALLIRQADPDLRVHKQAMVHVNDALLDARLAVVDILALLAALPLKTMQAEEVAILCLDNVFFCLVAPEAAELDEIGGIADRGRRC